MNKPNNDKHDCDKLAETLAVVVFVLFIVGAACYLAIRNVQQWQGMA